MAKRKRAKFESDSAGAQGRRLAVELVDSILADEEGWTLRGDHDDVAVEFLHGQALTPVFFVKARPGFAAVEVRVERAVVWIPFLSRLTLRRALRLFALRYANDKARSVLA